MKTLLRFAAVAVLAAASALAQGPALSIQTASITSGTAITASIDLKDAPILGIIIPSSWTTADLTFQASTDGTNFVDVYNIFGTEYTAKAAASRYIAFAPFEFQWARYVKIRSGTASTPVTQGGTRSLTIITRRVL